ncbi:glycosyltransferase family 2 protein [Anaerocolumna sp. AGMB13025]|uniref:glycosyltransferase family 2 protein n=1 Tax=Anaerocolumna sp. AGMB13025 TaxID=3039116 RepID=UPI00241F47EA|nr:glycosyltransferase family 2 protein [Anaerocolumna sp. AGMB13025]WFR56310.1 glycosyltransferase family 2 protein [Anaerocolumna sp. AGMB13025]
MKTITIVIPTYKEEANIVPAYEEVTKVMTEELINYNYEIMFIDNDSPDNTRLLIEQLCKKDRHVKAIFNARNFGQMRSHFYGLRQAQGDCAILLHADLQNPPKVMVEFVKEWEKGAKVVIGIKDNSKESKFMFFARSCYYRIMAKISDVEQIRHFSDFELLDKDFLDVIRDLHDPMPYLRGIVSELGFKMARVHYSQNKRERGKTTANFKVLYDFGMLGITSYSKSIMRLATKLGFVLSGISVIIAIVTFIMKICNWNSFPTGVAAIGVGVFLLGSVQLFFIGFLGEYILNINTRIMDRPLVIEEKRINFDNIEVNE